MTPEPRDRDEAILAFEERWPRHGSAKEEAIRAELGLAPARYYQLLDRLIDTAWAQARDPLLVGRLRRLRTEGANRRSARSGGSGTGGTLGNAGGSDR